MKDDILEITNLKKYYGKNKGIENVSLKLKEGTNLKPTLKNTGN